MVLVISSVFYFETVGVLDRSIDAKIVAISTRLHDSYGRGPMGDLVREIDRELTDGIDSDTEIFLVTSPTGQRVVGNLSRWPDASTPRERLLDRDVLRDGRPSSARIFLRALPDGSVLYVGRDLSEQRAIRQLVWRALNVAAGTSVIFLIVAAFLFRRQIETRIGEIRRVAHEIEGGDLTRRITISGDDEFARLSVDINRMLNRIEQLMNGVRHVSNAIAHDLRTPLTRVRSRLDEALRGERTVPALTSAARAAIEAIDDLTRLFNKLLQIAEAESGMRAGSFDPVELNRIALDMVELYDATAEERHVQLICMTGSAVWASGDHDLLVSAVASLIDNAIKYAGPGCRVEVGARAAATGPAIVVQDNGPGVPDEERMRLSERFYRVDRARSQPGNGLGLAITSAIATLHGGRLELADVAPGLRASIVLPPAPVPAPGGEPAPTGAAAAPAPLQVVRLSNP
jgi:signal transduction histidine kinase